MVALNWQGFTRFLRCISDIHRKHLSVAFHVAVQCAAERNGRMRISPPMHFHCTRRCAISGTAAVYLATGFSRRWISQPNINTRTHTLLFTSLSTMDTRRRLLRASLLFCVFYTYCLLSIAVHVQQAVLLQCVRQNLQRGDDQQGDRRRYPREWMSLQCVSSSFFCSYYYLFLNSRWWWLKIYYRYIIIVVYNTNDWIIRLPVWLAVLGMTIIFQWMAMN
jgi:hypothetical protein